MDPNTGGAEVGCSLVGDDTVRPRFASLFSVSLAAIKLTVPRQLTGRFGIGKVKEVLKDIVNGRYDCVLEKRKAENYAVSEHRLYH
jgi:hypothetical protein